MIPKIVNNLFERTLNSVSMNTTVERALSSSSSYSIVDDDNSSNSNCGIIIGNDENNKAMTTTAAVMACSPAITTTTTTTNGGTSNINSRSVQSLQSKLLAARKLSSSSGEQIDIIKGNNKSNATAVVVLGQDGYPLCQYRKGFFIHLKLRNLITSVSLKFYSIFSISIYNENTYTIHISPPTIYFSLPFFPLFSIINKHRHYV